MFHTPQISNYETLGASVDTKFNLLTWTNHMKTRGYLHDNNKHFRGTHALRRTRLQRGKLVPRGTHKLRGTMPLRGTLEYREA